MSASSLSSHWGWTVEARDHHIPHAKMRPLRFLVDTVGDAFFEAMAAVHPEVLTSSQDVLEATTLSFMSTSRASAETVSTRFVDEVTTPPAWLDRSALETGASVFLKYSFTSLLSLLYFSLLVGFSAPKITKVLDATGYLTKSAADATWRRLNETLDMVVRCMGQGAMETHSGDGFKSVLRVRMVHCRVRRRIMQRGWTAKAGGGKGDGDADDADPTPDGQPLNEMDMLVTLLSFSSNVLHTIKRCGAPLLSRQEEHCYLHLWRYIGHLLGVHDEQLVYLSSPEAARGATESLAMSLLYPNSRSQEIANSILRAISSRPPLRWSLGVHAAVARHLLGAPISDALAIQKPGLLIHLYTTFIFVCIRVFNGVAPFFFNSEVAKRVRARLRWAVNQALHSKPSAAAHVAVVAPSSEGRFPLPGASSTSSSAERCPFSSAS